MAAVNGTETDHPEHSPELSQDVISEVQHNAGTLDAEEPEQGAESIFQLKVLLPHAPNAIDIVVSSAEQVQDVRQSIIEQPDTFQYSCFHLEHEGERINDFTQLSEVKDLAADSELKLVEDPYTEKEARIHVMRVRELIGAAGDRTDGLQGILSGLSLHDSVTESSEEKDATSTKSNTVIDYDFEAPGSLSSLLPIAQKPKPKTVKSISVSSWNPPPYHLRQKGHLMYLQILTLEGESHQVTAHVSGFYVNKSTTTKFDPFPKDTSKAHSSHSLLTLITNISQSFGDAFIKLQEFNSSKEPLTTFQITNATPASPWLVPSASSPLCVHQSDLTRTQESYLISGVENTETLRDWNEEFQSTRELPKETAQDRVFRERLTSKLFADYTEAATKGAVLVARGEVSPLNPTESRDAQIFVYNNVFFSFGADGVGTFASEGGDEAARVATGKDVSGVRMANQLDIDGLFTPGTVVVDYLGKRVVGQSIVPGIFKQRDPGENQIDYGAVDGKDVVAADEKFVAVFEKLSKALKVKKHAVWDKSGNRHELEGSVETKGLIGTDGRKYVLDLYRVTPLDIIWMEENGTALGSPEKTNGAVESGYPHRMTVLRPELIDGYYKTKLRAWVNEELGKRRKRSPTDSVAHGGAAGPEQLDKQERNVDPAEDAESTKLENFDQERIDISKFHFSLNPDAFSGQEPQTPEEKQELASDEQEVRTVAEYLRTSVLPDLVRDLKEGDVGFPMDGESLSRLLHKRGINLRYLGELATLAVGKRLEALQVLAVQEMISRAFKHVAGRYLRYLPLPFTGACIAHLLNCLLGKDLNNKPAAEVDETLESLYADADLGFRDATPDTLKKDIELQVVRRFRFTLPSSWSSSIKHLQLLRGVCLKLGIQLEHKDYRFSKARTDLQNGSHAPEEPINSAKSTSTKKKGKKVGDKSPVSSLSPKSDVTFTADNILNIVPIIKEASPKSSLAEEALEAGRISIMQGQKKLGQDLLLESLSLHEQIYGILHPEVARVYNTLSMLYYQLEEKEAAVELARKSVIVSERTIGVDSAETLLSYLNLGLFLHANGDTQSALVYIRHALQLWKVIYGVDHPDSITTINNAAVMLQHLKSYHESRLWFEASLQTCETIFGKSSINTATLLFQLAQALALDEDSKAAVGRMKESYNIFLNALGPEDKNTKEAESWLEQLTQNAVNRAKQARLLQSRRGGAGIRVSPRVTLGQTQPQRLVGQTTEAMTGHAPQRVGGLDPRSIDELLRYIEGKEEKPKSKGKSGPANPKRRGGAKAGTKN